MRLTVLAILVPSLLLAPFAAHAQQAGKVYRIGHVAPADFDQPERIDQKGWAAFVQALRSFGWIEGKNFVFERRVLSSQASVREAAEELVRKKVDVIVLAGGARVDELPAVFAEMRKERDGAILIWDDPAIDELAPQILDLAVKYRLPTIVDGVRWSSWALSSATAPSRTTCSGRPRPTWTAS